MRLFRGTVEGLKAHRKRQLEEKLMMGQLWRDTGLVFTTTKGTPLDVGNLAYGSFRPLLKGAGLPDIRLYDLRHSFATLWLEFGEHSKILQEILGHSRISVTLGRPWRSAQLACESR